jgi:DNA-binding NtrC family response regulator
LRYIRSFETALSGEKAGVLPSPSQVICTSRKPLRTQVLAGAFLPEIYYRLNAVSFSLPALRDRKEDIPSLAQMFIDAVSREQQRPLQGLGPGSLQILLRHLWPGNVRELESVIRAACLSGEGQWLRPIDLVILPLEPAGTKSGEPAIPENYTLDGVIRRHILQVLKACDGNKARAASKLGISRSTLYRMLETDIAMPMQTPEVKQDELMA